VPKDRGLRAKGGLDGLVRDACRRNDRGDRRRRVAPLERQLVSRARDRATSLKRRRLPACRVVAALSRPGLDVADAASVACARRLRRGASSAAYLSERASIEPANVTLGRERNDALAAKRRV